MINQDSPLLLASSSRYRTELLQRLHLPFTSQASQVDETPQTGESVVALTRRLAREKALALAPTHPQRWILGSDQAAALGGRILGKPGTRESAIEQLTAASGQRVEFLTAVALVAGSQVLQGLDTTTVQFRSLSRAEIERYVDTEAAFDCAGSFKCEGYGITLFESIESQDPTALVGLPLITVRRLLADAGLSLP